MIKNGLIRFQSTMPDGTVIDETRQAETRRPAIGDETHGWLNRLNASARQARHVPAAPELIKGCADLDVALTEVRRENASLRAKVEELERKHREWLAQEGGA